MTLRLSRGDGPPLRIGHRGAAALAPPNTLEALQAALDAGVDMIEIDVLGRDDGSLVLAHSRKELAPDPPTLDEALAFLAERAPGTAVLADVKQRGLESELVEAIRRHRAVERTLVSAVSVPVLQAVGRLEPRLARSLTYPRNRALAAMRRTLPYRIRGLLASAGASVATLQYRVVSRPVVERCHAIGAAVFTWTVNDPALLARLDALGVDGVITDDPSIFGATLQA